MVTNQIGGGQLTIIIYVIALIALYYFLLVLPQRRRAQEKERLLSTLEVNDEIMTAGGIIGKVKAVKEDIITLQVDENVNLKLSKDAIIANITKERSATLSK